MQAKKIFGNVGEEAKWKNRVYTDECKKIYENIRFCVVRVSPVYNAVLPVILGVMTLVFWAVAAWNLVGLSRGEAVGAGHIVSFVMAGLLTLLAAGVVIYIAVASNKKSEPRYFARDGRGDYELFCKEDYLGRLTVTQIIHGGRHKSLYIRDGKCVTDSESADLTKSNGFYEFLAAPNHVVPKKVYACPRFCYKKKKTAGRVTVYYFPSFDRPMLGTTKPRSLRLVDGVVTRICHQHVYPRESRGRGCLSYKYDFSHVNDDGFEIHIPRVMTEQAESLKFVLPLPSENIVYD